MLLIDLPQSYNAVLVFAISIAKRKLILSPNLPLS